MNNQLKSEKIAMAYDKENEISITEVLNKCPRIWENYHLMEIGELDHIVPSAHMYSSRGRIVHLAADRHVNGEEIEWDYDSFIGYDKQCEERTLDDVSPEMFNAVLPYVLNCHSNTVEFVRQTESIDFSNIVTEKRMKVEIGKGQFLTGKPDGFSPDVLLDWKSGKPNFMTTKSYRMQMAGYSLLIPLSGEIDNYVPKYRLVVYLGGNRPEVVAYNPHDIEAAQNEFITMLPKALEQKQMAYSGEHMRCHNGFLCTMCDFAGRCRGI